jgi:hypothetical protein
LALLPFPAFPLLPSPAAAALQPVSMKQMKTHNDTLTQNPFLIPKTPCFPILHRIYIVQSIALITK